MKGSLTLGEDAGSNVSIITLATVKMTTEHNSAFIKLQKKKSGGAVTGHLYVFLSWYMSTYQLFNAVTILFIEYLKAHDIP